MRKNTIASLPLAVTCLLLGSCNESPSRPPVATQSPAPSPAAADTLAIAPATGTAVPFVNPTKVGRALGEGSPSPPASRTR